VAKQAVVREVKSMVMSCDQVGNLLLVKFSFTGGKDATIFLPAHIVFWLLQHLPVNQDPNLLAPPPPPQIYAEDWDDRVTPRVLTLQCKQFAQAIRMQFELDPRPDMLVLLDRSNVELMRQFMENYRGDLMDLGVF
jgi:hypothetical protein